MAWMDLPMKVVRRNPDRYTKDEMREEEEKYCEKLVRKGICEHK